ncbi:acetyltransferase [Parazoarcus communis]|uniref:Acetyltransferase n=1 Tax=Parazoarcus communis TaxID=41977 RepID=A0A2U8H7M0_9RHOO|nr:acyltransferase [Parazoarcus communis]AWI81668.1 acetyltransferase [Parazoarcus communis]
MFDIGIFFKIKNRLSTFFQFLVYPIFFKSFGVGSRILRSKRVCGSTRIEVGSNTFINNGGWIEVIEGYVDSPLLSIGNRVYIGNDSHIIAIDSVVIEDSVIIADRVHIADYSHRYDDVKTPIIDQPLSLKGAVRVGSGTWIGEGVVIIGAKVGKNCVIGAMSLVNKDIPDYSVAVGVPAKVVRYWCKETGLWVQC